MRMTKPFRFRLTEQVEHAIRVLREKYPKAYPNLSSVVRAGIMQLYKQRIIKGDKNF